jgi:hypothetical protein
VEGLEEYSISGSVPEVLENGRRRLEDRARVGIASPLAVWISERDGGRRRCRLLGGREVENVYTGQKERARSGLRLHLEHTNETRRGKWAGLPGLHKARQGRIHMQTVRIEQVLYEQKM